MSRAGKREEVKMPDVRLFDSRELRRTFGTFVTGVTVMTAVDEGGDFTESPPIRSARYRSILR
jgi:flavin reductase (DIM6/NTAB) family NADH-FMN oxidoreductase RutF